MQEFFADGTAHLLSFKVGARKPDPRMWGAVFDHYAIARFEADRILYIDDIGEYCTSFSREGVRTLQYNCLVGPTTALEKAFSTLGVLI